MTIRLMYITNKTNIAQIAENSGVERIIIDLEKLGKKERQRGRNTVLSDHSIKDIEKTKRVLKKSQLLVRINPIHKNTKDEIVKAQDDGADIIMLPYFKKIEEVEIFLKYIDGKTKTNLLFETPEAVDLVDEILSLDGINEAHIGMNDLHIGYNKKFMFELLADGTVEKMCNKFRKKNIFYGFGGIARIGYGLLPAEYIITEHYRVGSNCAILSRAFCDANIEVDLEKIEKQFKNGILNISKFEKKVEKFTDEKFQENFNIIKQKVKLIVES